MYTIYIPSNNLTWNIIHKADETGGFIEQVEEYLISWHDLQEKEIELALNFARETWGNITVKLCEEEVNGSYVVTKSTKEICL